MSDRPAPKFQIGEDVIVHSTFQSRVRSFFGFKLRWTAKEIRQGEGVITARIWDRGDAEWIYSVPAVDSLPFTEICLSKKFRPSTQSFTELLQSIQQPNQVKA